MSSSEEDDGGFVVEEPEDEFALEELVYGSLSKCRGKGERKRDKFRVKGLGGEDEKRE